MLQFFSTTVYLQLQNFPELRYTHSWTRPVSQIVAKRALHYWYNFGLIILKNRRLNFSAHAEHVYLISDNPLC